MLKQWNLFAVERREGGREGGKGKGRKGGRMKRKGRREGRREGGKGEGKEEEKEGREKGRDEMEEGGRKEGGKGRLQFKTPEKNLLNGEWKLVRNVELGSTSRDQTGTNKNCPTVYISAVTAGDCVI